MGRREYIFFPPRYLVIVNPSNQYVYFHENLEMPLYWFNGISFPRYKLLELIWYCVHFWVLSPSFSRNYWCKIRWEEIGLNIKLILAAPNTREKMPLKPNPKLWSKIFHLPCTKHVNIHISNHICLK